MKKTNLLNLAIQIIGIVLFVYSLNSVKELLLYISLPITSSDNIEKTSLVVPLLLTITLQWLIALLFAFKPHLISNILIKNKEHQTEKVSLLLDSKELLKSALVIIGTTVILLSLPGLILATVKYINLVQTSDPNKSFDLTNIATNGLKILLASALVYFSNQITHYLGSK
ncbi:MAG: hypothetical protein LBE37_11445 [Sphingobacterium sp.]|jgi:hypothetical protein|nr:hypothetical protein [Sphingobacterium sp.]